MEYQLDKWKCKDWHKVFATIPVRIGRTCLDVCNGESFQGNRYEPGLEILDAGEKRQANCGYSAWQGRF